MSSESQADVDGLRRAGEVTSLTLDAFEAHVRAGTTTAELDAVAAAIFARHGGRSAPTLVRLDTLGSPPCRYRARIA